MDNVKSGNGSTAVGVTAAALAAAGVACLLLHRSLWIDRAGDPVALDATTVLIVAAGFLAPVWGTGSV